MQSTKDSFFLALRSRLQQVNPQRTVTLNGESLPGLLADESRPGLRGDETEVFFLSWGAVTPFTDSPLVNSTLMACECTFRYGTRGGAAGDVARGRELARMDHELLSICLPPRTAKLDYTGETPRDLGTTIFWQAPLLGNLRQSANELSRTATLLLFFYPEGGSQ